MGADLGHADSEEAAAERAARENFAYLTREDAQGVVLTATAGDATRPLFESADAVAALAAGRSLVVLETVSRIHEGPETNEGFRALVASLERIALGTGAAVVIVRHTSKREAKNLMEGGAATSYAGRGGSALSDAVRSSLVVTRSPGLGPVTLTAAKTTHAKEGDTVSWFPVVVPALECVRLAPRTPESQAMDDAEILRAWLATRGEGITRSTFNHETPPVGLTRDRAKAALNFLATAGRVVPVPEKRGRNNRLTDVYYLPHQLDGATLRKATQRRAA
jgi:hypothetical protein